MRLVWKGTVGEKFVVRDVQALMPELAYTTVMRTLSRLAQKGILRAKAVRQQRAHEYRCAMNPDEFLRLTSQHRVRDLVRRYGDAALAAFAASLEEPGGSQASSGGRPPRSRAG